MSDGITAEEFKRLKEKAQKVRDNISRAKGSLDSLKATLQEEFGVSSKSEAEALLAEMQGSLERDEKELEERMASFKEKWGAVLDAE